MCDQYNPTEIRCFKDFKTYNNELYALEFPDEWMKNHEQGTGPECYNCLDYASWRGVLIGYCPNCAKRYEGFSRGIGFYGKAVEYAVKDRPLEKSAYKTYLKDADLNTIGDIDFNPSHTLDAHYEWYDKMHRGEEFIKPDGDDEEEQNHIVEEGNSIYTELETNPFINIGDTIEYISNNQMGWAKYQVIWEKGRKDVKLIDSYELREMSMMSYV